MRPLRTNKIQAAKIIAIFPSGQATRRQASITPWIPMQCFFVQGPAQTLPVKVLAPQHLFLSPAISIKTEHAVRHPFCKAFVSQASSAK